MQINGRWVGYGLGDVDPKVADMKTFVHRKFAWVRAWSPPLVLDTTYDATFTDVVAEMQRRYGLPATGVMNAATQQKCGYWKPAPQAKPWLFTVHGTGQPDPLGPGLPADTARAVLDKYTWQPIGNYPAAAFPMWPSIMQGVNELTNQISSKPGPFAMAGYSQGAVVVGQALKHALMNPAGALHYRLSDLKKVALWGNPMRERGYVTDDGYLPPAGPDTCGILEDRLEGLRVASFQVADYAHADDMYAAVRDDDMSENERAICKIIMGDGWNVFAGPDSIIAQVAELIQRPIPEAIAMVEAMIDAGTFFATGTRAHGYDIRPAIDFLRS